MKWFRLLVLLNTIIVIAGMMHGQAYYQRQRCKNARRSKPNDPICSKPFESKATSLNPITSKNETTKIISSKVETTKIAQTAAKDAKEAHEAQDEAACNAGTRVKIQLASQAMQAAKAAEAALMGKEQVVERLDDQLVDVELALEEERTAVETANAIVRNVNESRHNALNMQKLIQELVKDADQLLSRLEAISNMVQEELAEKTNLLEIEEERVENLLNNLNAAEEDYNKTNKAACKAFVAAKKAQQAAGLKFGIQHTNKQKHNVRRWRRRLRRRRKPRKLGMGWHADNIFHDNYNWQYDNFENY